MAARPFFLFLSLLLLAAGLFGQRLQKEHTFTHYSSSNGLPSNQVNSVVQDDEGYMWIATADGLVRFDGTRYKTYVHRKDDSASIPSNALVQVMIDRKNNMWLLTADGRTGIFNTHSFRFRQVPVNSRDASDHIAPKRISEDEHGHLFLLVNNRALLFLDSTINAFVPAHAFLHINESWMVTGFAQQPGTKKYWVGISGIGLVIYNSATGNLSYAGHNTENEPLVEAYKNVLAPSDFLFDSKGRFWFSNTDAQYVSMYCHNLKENKPVFANYEFMSVFQSFYDIEGIFEQRDGTVWIWGMKVFGRFVEEDKKFEFVPAGYQNERSIDYRRITDLYEDREGNIWVGTAINGIFRFNPSQEFFTNIQHFNPRTGELGDGPPLSFMREKDGSILVGLRRDGFWRYDKQFKRATLGIKGINDNNGISIWSMAESKDSNTAWLGAQPGIYRYEKKERKATYYNPALLHDQTIRQIVEDKLGNLWIGTHSIGMFKWNHEKGRKRFEDGLDRFQAVQPGRVYQIIADSKGLIWIATASSGLYVVDPATDKVTMHFRDTAAGQPHIMDEGVTGVLEYSDSLVVITTLTRVLLYNRILNKTVLLGTPEILSGFISSLQKDRDGNLWIATTAALYRANIKSRVFIRFNRDDGITNDYFMPNSSYVLTDGRFLFGSSGQIVVFDPLSVDVKSGFPNISITEFRVMNRSLPIDSIMRLPRIELDYDDNSLSIDFSTLSYLSPILIQYRMENIDKDWKTADKTNQAIYSYLPAGHYTLQFRTIDSDGKVQLSDLQVAIRIRPPFWRSWWFFSLLALLGAMVLFWFDKLRMRRKEKMQHVRSSIASNLYEAINTALHNINILSEMARMKADKEPQKSKEFIEQIHSKSHNMIIAMDDMLWSISPDNDNMGKSVARMQEFIDASNNRRGIDTRLLADANVKQVSLDMEFRLEAFLLFKEVLAALLNTDAAHCVITLLIEKSDLVYRLNFNCSTCDNQQFSNLMDQLEKNKHAQNIRARFNLQQDKPMATLSVKMPIANN